MPRSLPSKICDSKAQLSDDVKVVEQSGLLSHDTTSDVYYLDAVTRDNHIALQSTPGVDVAIVDKMTTNALWAIKKLPHTQFDYFVTNKDLGVATRKHKNGDKSIIFFLNVVLYGSLVARDDVGKILSSARLYLQNPSYGRTAASRYDNPHVLTFPETSKNHTPTPMLPTQTPENTLDVEKLLENLDHQGELVERPVSHIITSTLKRYFTQIVWTKVLNC
jgi:hypothetical protein